MVNVKLTLVFATLAVWSSLALADCARGRMQQGSSCIANSKPPCADEYKQLGKGEFAVCVLKPEAAAAPAPALAPCPAGTHQKPDGGCEATKSVSGRGGSGG